MNRKFKSGLIFGVTMTVFYILEMIHEKDLTTTPEILKIVAVGTLCGTVAGALFGWTLGFLRINSLNPDPLRFIIEPGETLLFDTAANHFKGFVTSSGQLVLTNKRLAFYGIRSNADQPELSINMNEIAGVRRYRILGIFNMGLCITTTRQTTVKFEVSRVEEWIKKLTNS